jgi:hypothetical protein
VSLHNKLVKRRRMWLRYQRSMQMMTVYRKMPD